MYLNSSDTLILLRCDIQVTTDFSSTNGTKANCSPYAVPRSNPRDLHTADVSQKTKGRGSLSMRASEMYISSEAV